MWYEQTRELRESGRLNVVTVVPEQHGERTRLFMQWKRMSWPTVVDPFNQLELPYVPISVAVDEHGIVRLVQPLFDPLSAFEEFLATDYEAPVSVNDRFPRSLLGSADADAAGATRAADTTGAAGSASPAGAAGAVDDEEDVAGEALHSRARDRDLQTGPILALVGGKGVLVVAIHTLQETTREHPDDPRAWFRLGVAYRMRHDSGEREPGDFQAAVSAWTRSLSLDPNDYIVRRRLQQYGPRLDKPYPFYDWVETARAEIRARGETPIELAVEPAGSELAGRARSLTSDDARLDDLGATRLHGKHARRDDPDPEGRVTRDAKGLVAIASAVVPSPVAPGDPLRVHVELVPAPEHDAHWNNEVGPLFVRVAPPLGWEIDGPAREVPAPGGATSEEPRRVEFELTAPAGTGDPSHLEGYALYYVCEGVAGRCLYRRQDFRVPLEVSADAPNAES